MRSLPTKDFGSTESKNGALHAPAKSEAAREPRRSQEAQLIEHILKFVQVSERQRVKRTLNHVKARSEKGNFTFSDAESLSANTRHSYDPNNLDAEAAHLNTLDVAFHAAERAGVARELSQFVQKYQALFLQRRSAEEAEVTGESTAELLDWIQQQPHLLKKFELAANHCTKKREDEEKQLGFWGRMKAKWQRFREDLHDDLEEPRRRWKPGNYNDWIIVMSNVIQRVNAKIKNGQWKNIGAGKEALQGKHLLIALQEEFPELPLSQATYVPTNEPDFPERNGAHCPRRQFLYEWDYTESAPSASPGNLAPLPFA